MVAHLIDPRIKLRHLVCFIEVARLKSVVNAAEVLSISQPAASKTIQELEQLLGGSLFDRSKRNLFLTPFGEMFYRYASTGLAALRQGVDMARGAHETTIVRVGALPTVSARLLPDAVKAFTASGSGAHTRVITGPNDHLLTLLRTGDVDFVIGRMAEPDAMVGLSFEHLYSERVVMVVRAGHPLLSERRFDLSMIEPYQMLMPTPNSLIRRLVDRMLLTHGITKLRDEVETISDAFGRAYLGQTDAVWIISEGVVARDLEQGRLALLPVDTSETTGPVGLTMRTDTASTMAADSLKQAVRDVAARLR